MTNARVTVGYDVRRWTTYVLRDATEEELEALAEDGPDLTTRVREWDAAGRLEEDYHTDLLALSERAATRDANPEDLAVMRWVLERPAARDITILNTVGGPALGQRALDAQLAWLDGDNYPADIAQVMWGEGAQPDPARLESMLDTCRTVAAIAPRPGVLSVCAWMAWALGRPTEADAYASQAWEIDPYHDLTGIVQSFITDGHLPEWNLTAQRGA